MKKRNKPPPPSKQIFSLMQMTHKNPEVLRLIEKLDLRHIDTDTGEVHEFTDIELIFNQQKTNTMAKKVFKEVELPQQESVQMTSFILKQGREFTGLSKTEIDFKGKTGKKTVYVTNEDGNQVGLPTNFELDKKLTILYDSLNEDEREKVELYIEMTGKDKTSDGNTVYKFTVKYA